MSTGNQPFTLRGIAVAAFGPSLLFGLGEGAIFPVIALSAKELGASFALSGFIVALLGVGSLMGNIPAALITARYGERRSMIGASVLTVLALILCLIAASPWLLALGVFLVGLTSAVFLLARQTYLIEAVPLALRARALSTLGGTMRVGLFVGPFAGAAVMHFVGLSGAYWAAVVAVLGAGLLSFAIPELTQARSRKDKTDPVAPRMVGVLREHRQVYLTLGLAGALVSAIRACRQIIVPLWAAHIGLDAPTTAIVYGFMGSIDMLLFYPAGKVMDSKGRLWVALPSMLLMGTTLLLMPLTTGLTAFTMVCMALGLGNGIGSGLIMTVGADASPPGARTQFLGIWRLITDLGGGGGPLLLSGIMAVMSLAAGIAVIGSMGFVAAAMFWRWLPRKITN